VEALGLQDTVLFLGRVPHEDVAGVLAAADIVALPTVSEGMSLSLLEAMASGRPVVASDIPAIASFVEDGVTGRIVPVAQPPALARALVELLDDEDYANTLGARGRAFVAARYDQRTMVAGYEQVFLQVAGARGSEDIQAKGFPAMLGIHGAIAAQTRTRMKARRRSFLNLSQWAEVLTMRR